MVEFEHSPMNHPGEQEDLAGFADRVFSAVRAQVAQSRPRDQITYRLQFNSSFTFKDAAEIIPYLNQLGITHLYCSPYFRARPGSPHGYDVVDYNSLNPEIGSTEDYYSMVDRLHSKSMGQIVDFVPNHMSIQDNPWWSDVLENGPGSPFAAYFDIDWNPLKRELSNKVLLPILANYYGEELHSGRITLNYGEKGFAVTYSQFTLPVDPRSHRIILADSLERLQAEQPSDDSDISELQSIVTACERLPAREETNPHLVAERRREKEIIRKRLATLLAANKTVKAVFESTLAAFNGQPGDPSSYDSLHKLLEDQGYRLGFWRVAAEDVNYRRFFYVNELVALRMENPEVFEVSHRLLRRLLAENAVDGVRIDHIDGLFDPEGYLWRLQSAFYADLCLTETIRLRPDVSPVERTTLEEYWQVRFEQQIKSRHKDQYRPLHIVVEKILADGETLRQGWPVEGTTGYEFGSTLNGIFVDQKNAQEFLRIYRTFTGMNTTSSDIFSESKRLIANTSMAGEINILAHQLDMISEGNRSYRDFTLGALRHAIKDVISSFPAYRIYVDPSSEVIHRDDASAVQTAIDSAKRMHPEIDPSVLDYLGDTLLLKYPAGQEEEARNRQTAFVMRLQQFSSAIMAKGMEDTAFYRYFPLISLNEVGGNPGRFGNAVKEFHDRNASRLEAQPFSMISTATHDSKRGEDLRARINVLSEMPHEWNAALQRWSHINEGAKTVIRDEPVPDTNTEYFIYQVLLGTYVCHEDETSSAVYRQRIGDYIQKSIREAHARTSWIRPNVEYEEAVQKFLGTLLEPSPGNPFLDDFQPMARRLAICGSCNSLSQLVLKLFSPGNPDFYQGTELWDFTLVDPDNRRPVDFALRQKLLSELASDEAMATKEGKLSQFASTLARQIEDPRIKLYVMWKGLNFKRLNPQIFYAGTYVPLVATGGAQDNVCAFACRYGDQEVVVVSPRMVAELTENGTRMITDSPIWSIDRLALGKDCRKSSYRNIFTDERVDATQAEQERSLPLSGVFSSFPVAVLEGLDAGK